MSTENLSTLTTETVPTPTTLSTSPAPPIKKLSKSKTSGTKKTHAKKHLLKRGVVVGTVPSIRRPAIKRLARRGGVKRLSKDTYDEVRKALENYLQGVVKKALLMTHHDRRKTVQSADIVEALKLNNSPIYGI